MNPRRVLLALGLFLLAGACASSSRPREPRYTIIKPSDRAPETGGIPPHKEAEIQLLLQQREPSARKCYQDVLNERNDRSFQGTVRVLIGIEPSGRPASVEVVGGTMDDSAVRECLVATIREFEFPELSQSGQVQYEYIFRPAY